ncbi:MAG: hemerythrin family protein [Zoogloeaceae bacterium]|nr:hemerythrin family protein [Rhodocyclaceae bacterium]MCP5235562.1 hemerythrin family protein [Zoogloeaceae bacterium]
MPLIEWNASMATGHMEIDAQHTVLVAILNRLHESIQAGEGEATTALVLRELIEYTRYHFRSEEALMVHVPSEVAQAHKGNHARLIQQVREFEAQCERGEISPQELLDFLKDWLLLHITGTDKQLASSLSRERQPA